jgi:hypothetical protein
MPAELSALPAGKRRRLSNVAPQFIDAAINAAGVSSAVESVLGRTSGELRDEDNAAGRWTAAIDEVRCRDQQQPTNTNSGVTRPRGSRERRARSPR